MRQTLKPLVIGLLVLCANRQSDEYPIGTPPANPTPSFVSRGLSIQLQKYDAQQRQANSITRARIAVVYRLPYKDCDLGLRSPLDCVEADDAAVVVDAEVRMMIVAMRDPRQRIHERHRLVIVGERKRLFDAIAGDGPSGEVGNVRGELVGIETGRPRAAGHGRQGEYGGGQTRGGRHGPNL